ncbi:zinc ribbon domain-containing protein [Vitiosangium sp. GDMCC 1.1324]|uniref:zinc ribbon domain-containing protein n=1 Tax=Vitiosangium sp. (strain GDMCC 1.1324) TaxID=2138576 RepID=UPI000D38D5FB|nr:zinc ribbon domain-containing protein [Vitiosangium sp. GDMCC 1.1324]PTL83053.1 hypothetical protein DAT35_13625 [Vitiosangium sp. GDMCC 1.1324]
MNCSNCGHAISDESLGFCTECGQLLDSQGGGEGYNAGEDGYNPDYAWEAPPPSAAERLEQLLSKVAEPLRSVGGLVSEAFQSVLDHPALRSLLPGGSLTLLGLGLVGLALLLSMVPFIAGIGVAGAAVMLLMAPLVAVNEWRLISQPELQERGATPLRRLPESLENLPEDTQHPAIAQLFALLTCTFALRMLGVGFISLVWLLAALMLGYDQGRIYFADTPEDSGDLEAGTRGIRSHRWVVLGVVICSFSLLLPWTRGTLQVSGLSGAEQPLSPLTQGTLLLLACSAVRHRGLSALHPLVLILMGVWVSLWFFLMMSPYAVGPWFYLPGLLVLDGIIVFHFLPQRRAESESPPEELASDMDSQG